VYEIVQKQESQPFVGSKMESNSIHFPTNETSDCASFLCNFRLISRPIFEITFSDDETPICGLAQK
jgi:hypothetical protein